MCWQIQRSPLTNLNKARFRLNVTRNGCIKPLCSYGTFNTGLKHQRLRTACSGLSMEHIWNLPAIYTLVIYKNIFRHFLTKWHCKIQAHGIPCNGIILAGTPETCCSLAKLQKTSYVAGGEVIQTNGRIMLYLAYLQTKYTA